MIALDANVGYGSSTKSMRYDFPQNASARDFGMRPGFIKFPRGLTHVWVEFVVRFSTNFTVNAGATDGTAAEYKLGAMGDYFRGIGRWNLPEMDAGYWAGGYPGNEGQTLGGSPRPSNLWDNQPHVFRCEAKLSPSGNGGIYKFWVDGVLISSQSGFNTDPSHSEIDTFAPGLNMNQGPSIGGIHMWWHKIAVYSTNPGW
jgi:hypothetical protein